MHSPREVARAHLDVGVRADDRFFAIGQITRELDRQKFPKRVSTQGILRNFGPTIKQIEARLVKTRPKWGKPFRRSRPLFETRSPAIRSAARKSEFNCFEKANRRDRRLPAYRRRANGRRVVSPGTFSSTGNSIVALPRGFDVVFSLKKSRASFSGSTIMAGRLVARSM